MKRIAPKAQARKISAKGKPHLVAVAQKIKLSKYKKYPGNKAYYRIPPNKRMQQKREYPPPKHIAKALSTDDRAYGRKLTKKQQVLFSRVASGTSVHSRRKR